MLATTCPYNLLVPQILSGHFAWRIYTQSIFSGGNFITIKQIQIKDSTGTVNNIGIPFASSTESGSSPNNAFDLSSGTTWDSSLGDTFDEFVGIRFLAAVDAATYRMVVFGGGGSNRAPREFMLQYSDNTTDGINGVWEDADSITNDDNFEHDWSVTPDIEFTIPDPTIGVWNLAQSSFAADSALLPFPPRIILSNGDKTAEQPSVANIDTQIKCNIGHNRNKWYFEIDVSASDSTHVAVVHAHLLGNAGFPSTNTNDSGKSYVTGTANIGVAYNGDEKLVRFYKNGDLVSTQGGLHDVSYYPATSIFRSTGTCTLNTGGDPFSYDMPPGYQSWDTNQAAIAGWSSTTKNGDIVLSNDNTTATNSIAGGHKGAFTTNTRVNFANTYFEVVIDSGTQQDVRIGIAEASDIAANLTTALGDYNSVAWSGGGGGNDIFVNGIAVQTNIGSWQIGDVISVSIENSMLTYRLNNVIVGTVVDISSFSTIRGAITLGINVLSATINIGQQPFVYAIPDGLNSWDNTAFGAGVFSIQYAGHSYDHTNQDNNVHGITFNNDGSKMYLVGNGTDSIYQYSLPVPYDISVVLYDNVSFFVGGHNDIPVSVLFNSSGTIMYIAGFGSDTLFQYDLIVAFDLSTAIYNGVNLSVSPLILRPHEIKFAFGGTKILILDAEADTIFEFTAATPNSIAGATYSGVSFTMTSEDANPKSFEFNLSGSTMLMIGDNERVYEYTLSVPFDISTALYTGRSKNLASQLSNITSIRLADLDTKLFVTGNTTDLAFQYSITI